MSTIQFLNQQILELREQRAALTFERDRLSAELSIADGELDRWREREASVCPEDVGFVEYIHTLKQQLSEAKAQTECVESWLKFAEEQKQLFMKANEATAMERDQLRAEVERLNGDYWYRKATGLMNVSEENKRLFKLLEEAEADRDRYKTALEEIAEEPKKPSLAKLGVRELREIASDALAPSRGEET